MIDRFANQLCQSMVATWPNEIEKRFAARETFRRKIRSLLMFPFQHHARRTRVNRRITSLFTRCFLKSSPSWRRDRGRGPLPTMVWGGKAACRRESCIPEGKLHPSWKAACQMRHRFPKHSPSLLSVSTLRPSRKATWQCACSSGENTYPSGKSFPCGM